VRATAKTPFAPAHQLAVVFLSGTYEDAAYYQAWAERADVVIAADGGAAFLSARGIRPDLVVGDLDSLAAPVAQRLKDAGVEIVRHPVRKDATDGELAVDEALLRGADEVVLVGALGALDHTLGHLAILRRLLALGVAARLAAPRLSVCVLAAPAAVRLDSAPGTRVSVVPLARGVVVTLKGMEYPLENGALPEDACLGLGNAVSGAATVAVGEGLVAVLVESGGETFGRGRPARPGPAR
jgi:thiamine pyrophosphokinase